LAKQLVSANTALTRAQEDQQTAKSPISKRSAERRVADATARVADLQKQFEETDPSRRKERQLRTLADAQAESAKIGSELTAQTQGDAAVKAQLDRFQKSDMLGRLRTLQANPALAKQFLDSASFEKKSLVPIMKLFDPKSDVARDFENALRSIPDNAGLAKLGAEATTMTQRFNPLDKVAQRSRAIKSTTERMQVAASTGFLSTEDLENLKTQAMERGQLSLGANLDQLILKTKGIGKARASDALGLMKRQASELEHPHTPGHEVGMGVRTQGEERAPTQAEKEQAKFLRDQIKILESIDKGIGKLGHKENGMLAE